MRINSDPVKLRAFRCATGTPLYWSGYA